MTARKAEVKRPRGRPRRDPRIVRMTVYVPGDLKKYLQHRAINQECDLSDLVAEALEAYRKQERKK